MVAFMTLCESYMGIEPHFDLQNYFFRAQLQQGSDAEAITFGNVDIFVWSRLDVDPHFSNLMLAPPIGWCKAWF
jgi:hypothetical protein